MKILRLVLGDQLNHQHSWFNEKNDSVYYFIAEMRSETDYAPHHIQKVVAFFEAMKAFANTLESNGHQVIYYPIDHEENRQSITKNISFLTEKYNFEKFEYQLPDEYRLDQELKDLCEALPIESEAFDTEHFLTHRMGIAEFFKGKKTYLMERFYREMRIKHNLLMNGDEPEGGKWNYDHNNRKKLPKNEIPPSPKVWSRDASQTYERIQSAGVKTIGEIHPKQFIWPVTREESLELLEFFATDLLYKFGAYQDALHTDYWSIYHSRLSFAMNVKLLSPLEVVRRCIDEWQNRKDEITLSQIEGFVRQIIGWREYMRGVYWAKMPDYAEMNALNHTGKLPEWFWTGETKMTCLKKSIQQSLKHAYAHHIQRLMVTGNFALLAGVHPDEVDAWYLGIYIDAIEWVEMPNTRGMSQFADDGIVGTKPYNSSANYMHKMSNYCSNCTYDYKNKTGENACPFNSLYWNFYDRHQEKFDNNPRLGMAYRHLNKMDPDKKKEILETAKYYLEHIDEL
jgi:deoxyribodipyrimidine photolyase-related protein